MVECRIFAGERELPFRGPSKCSAVVSFSMLSGVYILYSVLLCCRPPLLITLSRHILGSLWSSSGPETPDCGVLTLYYRKAHLKS
jgi:hypothetical protein